MLAAKGAVSGGAGQGEVAPSSRNINTDDDDGDETLTSQRRQLQYRTWSVEEREVGLKALGRVVSRFMLPPYFSFHLVFEVLHKEDLAEISSSNSSHILSQWRQEQIWLTSYVVYSTLVGGSARRSTVRSCMRRPWGSPGWKTF